MRSGRPGRTTSTCTSPHSRTFKLLHLGVAATATRFRLESRAYNEAHFRVPDENDVQLVHTPLEPAVARDAFYGSGLPLAALLRALRAAAPAAGFDPTTVALSHDAGRFLCNMVYYRSLQGARRSANLHSLFVHVPPFAAIDADTQFAFLTALIDILVSGTGARTGPTPGSA